MNSKDIIKYKGYLIKKDIFGEYVIAYRSGQAFHTSKNLSDAKQFIQDTIYIQKNIKGDKK